MPTSNKPARPLSVREKCWWRNCAAWVLRCFLPRPILSSPTIPACDAEELARQLRERAIIVRHFRQPRIEQFLRITVGTDAQCAALVAALAAILGGAS